MATPTGIRQKLIRKYRTLEELFYAGTLDSEKDHITKQPNVIARTRYGQTDPLSSGIQEDVWTNGGTKVNLNDDGEALSIVSTSAQDAPGGTGLDMVYLSGLGVLGTPVSETLILNGTTPVESVRTYTFIQEATCMKGTATGRVNVGDITITGVDSSNVQGKIPIGRSLMQNSHFKVPTGYSGLFTEIIAGVGHSSGTGSRAANMSIYTSTGGVDYEAVEWYQDTDGAGAVVFPLKVPFKLPENTIFWCTATPESNQTVVQVQIEYVFIRDNIDLFEDL